MRPTRNFLTGQPQLVWIPVLSKAWTSSLGPIWCISIHAPSDPLPLDVLNIVQMLDLSDMSSVEGSPFSISLENEASLFYRFDNHLSRIGLVSLRKAGTGLICGKTSPISWQVVGRADPCFHVATVASQWNEFSGEYCDYSRANAVASSLYPVSFKLSCIHALAIPAATSV